MEVLEERVSRRRSIFAHYKSKLSRNGINFIPEPEGRISSRWLTTLQWILMKLVSPRRCQVRTFEHQIEARPLWKPMHTQPLYTGAPYHGLGLDEQLFENGLCLPSGSDMTSEQQDEVIEHFLSILDKER